MPLVFTVVTHIFSTDTIKNPQNCTHSSSLHSGFCFSSLQGSGFYVIQIFLLQVAFIPGKGDCAPFFTPPAVDNKKTRERGFFFVVGDDLKRWVLG